MQEIFKKLDLEDYISSFQSLFARDKEIILEGDINLHYKLINELDRYEFKEPPKVSSLDTALMHIQKQGILRAEDIFEVIKIIRYFIYLKKFRFEGKVAEWFEKIVIPPEILNIEAYFDDKGEVKEGVNDDLDMVKQAIYTNKDHIKQALYKIINNQKIRSYLVDSQVHFING